MRFEIPVEGDLCDWDSRDGAPLGARLSRLLAGGLCALRLGEVSVQDDTILIRQLGCALVKGGAAEILQRYLERLAELGLDCSLAAPLIVDLEGEALSVERLLVHYQTARTIRVAMEALRREGLVGERRILTTGGEESVVGGAAIDSFTGSGRDAAPLSGTAHTCRDHGRHKRPASSIIASTLSGCIKRLRIARYGWFPVSDTCSIIPSPSKSSTQ